jgi:mono/diheme cytochrome c family protein
MQRLRNIFVVVILSMSGWSWNAQAVDGDVALAMFQQSCIKCHGQDGKVKGKLNLLKIKTASQLTGDLERLQTILEVLDTNEMPPEKEPPLKLETRAAAVADLQKLLRAATAGTDFAPTPIRRMNRLQYNNAVQDLLGLKVSVFPLPEKMMRDRSGYFAKALGGKMPNTVTVSSRPLGKSGLIEPRLAGVGPFPQDPRAEHGFDNRGDHLSLSPFLLEAFFKLSRRIVQSPNFDGRTVGIWKEFFVAPPTAPAGDVKDTVRARLRKFMTRAFRRPVPEAMLNRYAQHVHRQIDSGMGFTEAMKEAASAVLSSPRFLYLYNRPMASDKTDPLDGYDLASRLSFFLWGSIPDDVLLELAGSGELAKSAVRAAQVNRMLASPKLKRFCDSFPSQWLQLDRIVSAVPDEIKYKDFFYAAPNYRTTMDMMMEPLLLFETVLIENRSILEFIDSGYTYRSGRLRKWYGDVPVGKIGGPVTMQFTRQPVTDRRQGGVITTGAVMTMTSGPDETKPITRGAWIAGVIFNAPPEPPPADVPPLEEPKATDKKLTMRERFAAHRERADCAGCHAKLDPLGFALENFDPVGRWRDGYENGREVDASGVLFRKHKFTNVVEFKDAILAEKDRFTRAFAGHLLSYALGRGLTPTDATALDRITAKTIADGYRLQTLIHEVVQSAPFVNQPRQKTASANPPKNSIKTTR